MSDDNFGDFTSDIFGDFLAGVDTYPLGTGRSNLQYVYNNAGQVVQEISDITVTEVYDQRGLLTRVNYDDGTYDAFSYDAAGRMISDFSSRSTVSTAYQYDSLNRLTDATRTIEGVAYHISFSYDEAGNVIEIIYPDGGSVEYAFDSMNRVKAIVGYLGSVTEPGVWYDAASRLKRLDFDNDVTTIYTYNSLGRLQAIQMPMIIGYAYDAAGNVIRMGDQSFTYDGLNRLKTASQPGQNYSVSYEYDGAGNRIQQNENGQVTGYVYDALNQLVSASGDLYTHDARGNMASKTVGTDAWDYVYDQANRLIEVKKNGVTVATFGYAADGSRAYKTENGVTTHYLDIGGKVQYEANATTGEYTCHIYLGNQEVAQYKAQLP